MKYSDEELMSILIEEIDNFHSNVTDWEADFIESIYQHGIRSDKQREVIYRMMKRYGID